MGKPEKPRIEELAEELEFLATYREVRAEKIDIGRFYSLLATK
jgi:hypothetical protein